jgi:hypothetical protein
VPEATQLFIKQLGIVATRLQQCTCVWSVSRLWQP